MVKLPKICGLMMGVVVTASVVQTANASYILSDLINNNGTITVGDKVFSNFGYIASGDNPAATGVTVNGFDNSGLYGIRFTANFHDNNTVGASDALITYTVTVTDPAWAISQVYIAGPAYTGDHEGYVQVNEAFYEDNGVQIQIHSDGSQLLQDVATLQTAQTALHVTKDILLWANDITSNDTNGVASLAYVDQYFGQVPNIGNNTPEPASLALLGLGTFSFLRRRK